MSQVLVVASLSPHKLAAVKSVFSSVSVSPVDVSVSFNPPQPVGDEYGLVCASLRLQNVSGPFAVAIESFVRISSNAAHDVVCAVLRRGSRVFWFVLRKQKRIFFHFHFISSEVGGEIEIPFDIARECLKHPHSAAGTSVTAGSLLVKSGRAKDATNWHVDLAGVQRSEQIAKVLQKLINAEASRCTELDIRANLLYTPNFPKTGVLFKDLSPLFGKTMLRPFVRACLDAVKGLNITLVAGLEARGLALGALLAHELNAGFVMVRKAGKLPPPTEVVEYGTEYSTDKLELSASACVEGAYVLLADDLVATGGSLLAAAEVKKQKKRGKSLLKRSFFFVVGCAIERNCRCCIFSSECSAAFGRCKATFCREEG